MNETQARTFFEARSHYTQDISRKTKLQLTLAYHDELRAHGQAILFGGPATKTELISVLVEMRYPLARMNEAIHVLYHTDGIVNEVCAYCNPDPCPVCGELDGCTWNPTFGAIVNGRHVNA